MGIEFERRCLPSEGASDGQQLAFEANIGESRSDAVGSNACSYRDLLVIEITGNCGHRIEPFDGRLDRLHTMAASHVGNLVFLHLIFLL